MAERLVACGVRGIWNFTNMELEPKEDNIVIENVHFADSLLALSYMDFGHGVISQPMRGVSFGPYIHHLPARVNSAGVKVLPGAKRCRRTPGGIREEQHIFT